MEERSVGLDRRLERLEQNVRRVHGHMSMRRCKHVAAREKSRRAQLMALLDQREQRVLDVDAALKSVLRRLAIVAHVESEVGRRGNREAILRLLLETVELGQQQKHTIQKRRDVHPYSIEAVAIHQETEKTPHEQRSVFTIWKNDTCLLPYVCRVLSTQILDFEKGTGERRKTVPLRQILTTIEWSHC